MMPGRTPSPSGDGLDAIAGRIPPWGIGEVIQGVLWVLFFGIIWVLVAIGIDAVDIAEGTADVVLSALIEITLFSVALVYAARRQGAPWRPLGFSFEYRQRYILYTVLAIALSLVAVAIYGAILDGLGLEDSLPESPLDDDEAAWVLVAKACLATFAAPLCEETFFRGFAFAGFLNRFRITGAAVISGLLFTLAHLDPIVFIPIFLIGIILARLYARTGSLWYAILAHMGYNGIVVLAAWQS